MRREIETAPRDGNVVVLEDDTRGTYELAHWSTEQMAWVGEDDKLIPINPTHWLPLQRPSPQEDALAHGRDTSAAAVVFPIVSQAEVSQPGSPAWRRLVISSIAAVMIASSLIGMYFRASITAYLTEYAPQHDNARIGRIVEQRSQQATPLPIQEMKQAELSDRASAVEPREKPERTVTWGAGQTTMASPAKEISKNERSRADGLESELAELQPSTERCELRLRDAGATAPKSQEPDRKKTSVLLHDLAAPGQELTPNEVQYRKALAEECDRSAALASELATAQQNVETLSNKTANEVAQLKKVADNAALELQRERERAEALASELAKVRQEAEAAAAVSSRKDDEAGLLKRKAETAATELQQSLQQEQKKTAALTQEVGAARQAMTASAEQQRRALEEAQARAAALASELAGTRREIETQAAQSEKAVGEAVQQKLAAESTTADLQQSPQQGHQRAEMLSGEVRRKLKALATLSRGKTASNQGTENAKAELRPSPPQKREQPNGNTPNAETKRQSAGAAATEQPVSAEANGSESARLMARAKALVAQGNIRAARDVLERAVETGSAQAIFALAETYDPNVLATWRTRGTLGDATRARDLYARAHDGGVKAAKDRSRALVISNSERKPASWFGREEAEH